MDKEEFKMKLVEIDKKVMDTEIGHENLDDFLVEVLESHGYDLTYYKNLTKWYA